MDARPSSGGLTAEFSNILALPPVESALRYAVVAYGMGRRAQIVRCGALTMFKRAYLEPGGPSESWGFDAAGVPPKIASVLMGHATPTRQPGAAQITLARYTHALPEDMEDARTKLAAYLAMHEEARTGNR